MAASAGQAWCDPSTAFVTTGEHTSNNTIHAYRRVFVPADRIDIWPREGNKYIPVEAKDFEVWLASLNNSTRKARSSATIDEANYQGSLSGADQLTGHGEWKITVREDGPTFLPLPGESLAIRNVRWKDNEKELVRLGNWGAADSIPNEYGLVVSRSGWLEFDWSIRRQLSDTSFDMPWEVPAALSTRLTIELPDGQTPSFDDGAVIESSALAQKTRLESGVSPQRRWVLAHGPGSGKRILHISSGAEPHVGHPERLELRGKVSYQAEQRGLEVQVEWKLEGRFDEQRELAVPLPAGIQLLSAGTEGQELSWRIVRNTSPKADQALISLPRDSDIRLLNLKAVLWQPITFDEPWQLPNIWPENVFWRSAEMFLSVAPELELRRLEPIDCLQTGVTHLGDDSTEPEIFSIAAFAPTSVIRIILGRRDADIRVRAGTSLALTDPDVIGRHVARWSVSRGQVHQLTGVLGRGWTVETVETTPADAMAEWFIERHDDHRHLEIRLTDAVTPTREISVIVTGRLQRFNVAEAMSADMLRMVDWNAGRVTRQLLSFQTSEPYVVEAVGGAIAVPRESFADSDRELLDETAERAVTLDLANAGKDTALRLLARRGQYSGDIEYEAECSGEGLKHSWQLVAQPRSNAIDRLLVYSTAPLGGSARWSEKATDLPISAELLSADDPLRKNVPREGEAWLLRLAQPSNKPVAISLSIAGSLPSPSTVPVLALPEAIEQAGRITVRAMPEVMPSVQATGIQPLPLALGTDEAGERQQPPTRLAYRYAPQDCFDPSRAPRLVIGAAAKADTPRLTIRHLKLESFYRVGESTRHRITYELQNFGATDFKATFHADVKIAAVYVDGLPISLTAGESTTPTIPLSARVSSPNVTFLLERPSSSVSTYSTIESPIAEELYPVLGSEWVIWLSQDIAAIEDDDSVAAFNWRQRIFGILAPDGSARSLDLSRLVSWTGIVGRAVERDDAATDTREGPNRVENGASFASTLLSLPVPSAPAINLIPAWSIVPQEDVQAATTSGSELLGWHSVIRHFVGGGPHGVVAISRPATLRSWAIACLLISLFVNCLSRYTWRIRVFEIVAACCLALIIPETVAPLATGLIWGVVFSQLWEWFIRSMHSARAAQLGVPLAARAILVVSLLALCSDRGLAAEGDVRTPSHIEGSKRPTQIESVLIPVDGQKKPVGTKVFVSEHFLQDLLGKSQGSTLSNHRWVISAAAYSGELTETRRSADFATGVWTLAFNLETSARQTLVRLPLIRAEATWQPTAMLDGVPQPTTWEQDGRSCIVMIPEPGHYVLSIFCSPKIEKADGRGQLRLSIPTLPAAKLALQIPQELSGVQLPNAILAPPSKDRPDFISGELFYSSQIALSWDLATSKDTAAQRFNISELNWVKVSERGIELATKYLVEGAARRPESLTVRYDDRWMLLTEGVQLTKNSLATKADHLQSLQLPLPSVAADRQEVVVRWRLSSKPEVGSIRIVPTIISPTPTTQRWFAVSADSMFDCALIDNSIATTTAKEFQNKWGNDLEAAAPQIALANVPDDKRLTISIRPLEQTSSIREILHVGAGIPTTRVFYQADIAPGPANAFQVRLSVSPTLNIDKIALATGDQQIPIRWTRDDATRITVFFGAPVRNNYRLAVSGNIPSAENQSFAVPRISALQNGTISQTVQLHRDDNVNVSLQGFPEQNSAKPGMSTAPPIEWLVRPVGTFTLNDTALQAGRIVVQSNRPVVQGDSLTQLLFKDGKWFAEVRTRLVAEQGNLDVLQLIVPSRCVGPFEIEASVPVTTDVKLQPEGRQVLAVRLGTSVAKGKEFTLRLRTLLVPPSGVAPSVPDVQIRQFLGRRLIGVPKTLNTQPLSWTSIGAKPSDLSDEWRGTIPDSSAYAFFETANSPFTIELQPQSIRQSAPGIRLAETCAVLDQDGGQLLISRFAILPDGIKQCVLSLPADHQLLSLVLDGQPAVAVPTSASEWQVTLESAGLAQMLTVVSRAADTTLPNRAMLERPTLRTEVGPMSTNISLWSLVQLGSSEPVVAETASSVSEGDFNALRFDRLVSLVEKTTTAIESIPRANAARWRSLWASVIREAQAAAVQAREASKLEPTIAQPSYSADEQIQLAGKRFEAWSRTFDSAMNSSQSAPPTASSWTELTHHFGQFAEADRPTASITNYVFDGDKKSISLKTPGIAATTFAPRFLAVAAVVAMGLLLVWLPTNACAVDFVFRWPHAFGVLGGILYWTFLWPSWLGLIIVAASLWLGLRTAWPGRAIRPEASTVLRSTRTLPTQ